MFTKLIKSRTVLSVAVSAVLALVLLFIPTGYENAGVFNPHGEERVSARVVSVDNSTIKGTGLVQAGEQSCEVELLSGSHKGEIHTAENMLSGSLEQDKIYEVGEEALVLVTTDETSVLSVSMIDHFRVTGELVLLLAFFVLLIVFAGWTGVRTMLSFVLTILMIWKVLIPSFLQGANPLLVGSLIAAVLTVLIIGLVFGFDRRCLAACTGSAAGLALTCVLGVVCTNLFKIQGAVMPFSESLLYSGFQHLDLTQIFMASIFIGSSGAVMDLSVDIFAAVQEIVEKRPDLSWTELVKSGMSVGRAAMGTMITTLLLAYSGGYVALLMVFMAQGTPLINIFNYKYVASEIVQTLVGSLGLVFVAPFTALTSGIFLAKKQHQGTKETGKADSSDLDRSCL